MTESTPRIPESLQRRPKADASGAKILVLGASVAAGIAVVGAMAASGAALDNASPGSGPVPAPERVIVVRVPGGQATTTGAPTTAVPSTTAVPTTAAPATAAPAPVTVSEGS